MCVPAPPPLHVMSDPNYQEGYGRGFHTGMLAGLMFGFGITVCFSLFFWLVSRDTGCSLPC